MPPPRRDAAHSMTIAPYLTHLISHHGQLTLVPPDNNGRRRKAKENQSQSSRNTPREEPVRFSGSSTTSPASVGRPSRRGRRPSPTEEHYNDLLDDIPNYPPPSFLEAMSSPPVSVCPSTTTLGRFTTSQGSRHNSDSDSESDDASLDIIDAGNPSHSSGRPRPQSQAPPRGRGILDSDADDPLRAPSSSNTRSHRRHLSLSPLRTLFPTRNPRESGHALSAQSTPSTHSLAFSRSSPFFRSTTSLRNLTSSTPLPPPSPSSPPSLRSEFLASRRFFSHKGKERATSESLDSWEIVESEDLPVPTTPPAHEEHSPIYDIRPGDIPPPSPVSVTSAPVHPLSERDRQVKSRNRAPVPPTLPSPQRERERRAPPPLAGPVLAAGEAPPIVTVRTKKPPPPPPPKKKPTVPSPLRDVDGSCALPELDLDRAMRTPLPLTPVTGSPTSLLFPFSMDPGSPARERIDNIPSPVPRSSSGASENGTVNTVDVEGQQSHQHHYPGRPLPRRPRVVVDSTYAPHPDFPQVELLRPAPSVPEGLLINLDADAVETPTAQAVHTEPFASVSADLDQLTPVATSSADLNQLTPMATDVRRHSSASSVDLAPAAPPAEFLELTELDILIARLENDQRDGGNYDALLMISDIIGPATPVRANGSASSASWQTATKTSVLLTGHIEVQRRRITKDGRTKLKLALLGTAVDRCGICMTQFKKAERAQLSGGCQHAFHHRCLARWVARSRTCPLCRLVLDLDAGGSGCQ